MNADFTVKNLTVIRIDWSFVPEVLGETATEEDGAANGGAEEGEVTGAERVAEDVVIIDEPEVRNDPSGAEQAAPADQQPCSVVWGPLECGVCQSRVLIGPAQAPLMCGVCRSRLLIDSVRAPPMVGSSVPSNDPSPTLTSIQIKTFLTILVHKCLYMAHPEPDDSWSRPVPDGRTRRLCSHACSHVFPILVRVRSFCSCRRCGCPRVSGRVVAAPRAFSTRAIVLVSLLITHVPPVGLVTSSVNRGQRVHGLSVDLGCLVGVDYAASSRAWGSWIFCDSQNASKNTQMVSVKLWTFPIRVVKALDVLAGSLVHGFIAVGSSGKVG
ncbi:hypothetical protein TIFTF001_053629, partial [Ficus carica]